MARHDLSRDTNSSHAKKSVELIANVKRSTLVESCFACDLNRHPHPTTLLKVEKFCRIPDQLDELLKLRSRPIIEEASEEQIGDGSITTFNAH